MRRRNKYLYQLILTGAVLVIVPTIFFFAFFLKRSFEEINAVNIDYYENMCETFGGAFTEKITEAKSNVLNFATKSWDGTYKDKVIYKGTEKMAENPYYYWEAAAEIAEYGKGVGNQSMGVYYYDADFILCDEKKYTVQLMIKNEFGEENGNLQRLENFFSEDVYVRSKMIFAPVYGKDGSYQELLVGFCTFLGEKKEKVLCFYRLKPEDMSFFYQSTKGRSWEKYYVMDSESGELLYGIGEVDTEKDFTELLFSVENQKEKYAPQESYVVHNVKQKLTFVLDVSEDREQNNVFQFYRDMQKYMLYVLLLMIGVAVLAMLFAPFEVDVTAYLKQGENQVTIVMLSGNRNLLGPHHRPEGESYSVGPSTFSNKRGWADNKALPTWTEDYSFVLFGCEWNGGKDVCTN